MKRSAVFLFRARELLVAVSLTTAFSGVLYSQNTSTRSRQPPLLVYERSGSITDLEPAAAHYASSQVDTFNLEVGRIISLPVPVRVKHIYCGGVARDQFINSTRTILLCQETIDWFAARLVRDRDKPGPFNADFEREALWFTLGHELAHAIVEQGRLPLTGDREAAVDELSALMLLESSTSHPSTSGGALLLLFFGELEDEGAMYTHHGSSKQRGGRMDCLDAGARLSNDQAVMKRYASGPERNPAREAELQEVYEGRLHVYLPMLGTRKRVLECEREYPIVLGTWRRLLGSMWIGRGSGARVYRPENPFR